MEEKKHMGLKTIVLGATQNFQITILFQQKNQKKTYSMGEEKKYICSWAFIFREY